MRKIWIAILAVAVFACGENHDFVTESGVEVACIRKGEGGAFIKDSVLLLNLKITTETGQVLIENEGQPMPLLFNPEMAAGHLQDVLNKMTVGDSVYFQTSAENLFQETYKAPLPDSIAADSKVNISLSAIDQMSREAYGAYQMEQQQKMMSGQIEKDAKIIEEYLAENGIDARQGEDGLRYVITQDGNGTFADKGDKVFVNYVGRVINGEYFDTNMEDVAKEKGIWTQQRADYGYNEFDVTIGQRRVIQGWEQGIPLIPEGGKGTLYIPSSLGYGPRGSGAKIPPNSVLVFDVEVLKIEKQ
ncbi:FKBP-type peptidyl-prolyl cis-trans isomerase [Marinoscillum pacificum]|uniref:FKBP-type peptidyl-prolyl cis-trans isomerase n=1 Tax=Marinoscillum pacificum TaxID=392723 RepID=UPI002157DCEB|nr:FKBP-type peptidyl-prolyl cis-trans isomerase [Marinoscillum pacificum]